MTEVPRDLIGRRVEMTCRTGDGHFAGVTLRWGVLREITPDAAIIDDYHDSAGIGAYVPNRGCNVTDGVPVPLGVLVSVRDCNPWDGFESALM